MPKCTAPKIAINSWRSLTKQKQTKQTLFTENYFERKKPSSLSIKRKIAQLKHFANLPLWRIKFWGATDTHNLFNRPERDYRLRYQYNYSYTLARRVKIDLIKFYWKRKVKIEIKQRLASTDVNEWITISHTWQRRDNWL